MDQLANTPRSAENRIAFIQACWHKPIVDQARLAFIEELSLLQAVPPTVDVFEVPGSLEIPLQAKLLARTGRYAAIIAAGFVVNGGIYRHDFVADAVIKGIMRVQLDTDVPIMSVVLTPHYFHEHDEHEKFFFQHFWTKGREAASACIKTIRNLEAIRNTANTAVG